MPFIQTFLPNKKKEKNILFLSVDGQKIHAKTVDFARNQLKNQTNILWVEANLGVSDSDKSYLPLEKVLHEKAALPKAIRHLKHLAILSGKSSKTLAQCSEIQQKQFFLDINILAENYDQIIASGENLPYFLRNQWLNWAKKTFLLFNLENLCLEKTADFLKENANKIDALICLDKNQHQAYLAWIRLQKIIPNLPPLITEIEKTAQEI